MKYNTLDLTRVWAAITGIILALWYMAASYEGARPSDTLPLLVAAIGGFELFLFGQDLWLRQRGRHG